MSQRPSLSAVPARADPAEGVGQEAEPAEPSAPAESPQDEARVFVELFPSQLDQILRAVAQPGAPSISALLAGLVAGGTVRRVDIEERYSSQIKDGALSQSLLRGFVVLACFLPEGTERGIAELADQLELNISTVHRYVTTLVVLGLIEQSRKTRKYHLPCAAVQDQPAEPASVASPATDATSHAKRESRRPPRPATA